MKALVLYDSQYGNTEKVAQAIGEGIGEAAGGGSNTQILRIANLEAAHLQGVELLVVGSPTQKFNPTEAVNGWLKGLPAIGLKGVRVAAFDTRLTLEEINKIKVLAFFVRIFGYAARSILQRMVQKGGVMAAPAEGFLVQGMEGPLVEGELERAKAWGRELTGG